MASAMSAIGCGLLRIPEVAWYLLQAAIENRGLAAFWLLFFNVQDMRKRWAWRYLADERVM